jgi:hypothetical protein
MPDRGAGAGPWSPQDKRSWAVTFWATLAANLVTVLVVGGAVVVLHAERARQPHHALGARFWWGQGITLGAAVVMILFILVVASERGWAGWLDPSDRRPELPFREKAVLVLAAVFLTVIAWTAGVTILVLMGAAAGLK